MDQALDYWAWQVAVACGDGYPYHYNDFFAYGDPLQGGRFELSPWGMDESWNDSFRFTWGGGSLYKPCKTDDRCKQDALDHMEAALEVVETSDILTQLDAWYALSDQAAKDDPRKPYSNADVDDARAKFRDFVESWPATARDQIANPPPDTGGGW
jgi:hypothetical protein